MIGYIFCQQSYFVAGLLFPFYNICVGNLDTSSWKLTYNIIVPFSRATVFGWLMTWFVEFNMAFTYALSVVSGTSYFVCCCFYLEAICKHFDLNMRLVDEKAKVKTVGETSAKKLDRARQIKDLLNESVKLHVDILE